MLFSHKMPNQRKVELSKVLVEEQWAAMVREQRMTTVADRWAAKVEDRLMAKAEEQQMAELVELQQAQGHTALVAAQLARSRSELDPCLPRTGR